MQIQCPNCTTAYEIPDAVFGGRARKLRCENCGTQWRAGPPGADVSVQDAGQPGPQATESTLPPVPEGRRFGKPADAAADAEFRKAIERERQNPTPTAKPAEPDQFVSADPATAPAAEPGADSEDPFINLVLAARSRAIEFEPEPPPEPRFKISSPLLVGILLTLFVLSVGFLLFHARH
jgi:predicted Zn finger-like uncharacterized protein